MIETLLKHVLNLSKMCLDHATCLGRAAMGVVHNLSCSAVMNRFLHHAPNTSQAVSRTHASSNVAL